MPKKCGHFSGKSVVSTSEMLGKIHAAVDAREDENFQIIARTDACAVHGFDAAIERAHAFAEAGADILFIEAVETAEQVNTLPGLFKVPQLINIVIGGKTPVIGRDELQQRGFGIVLYANAALQSAVRGMQTALTSLKAEGRLDEDPAVVAPFNERQRLVNKSLFDELDQRYASND
jgi:2-methylisocitrate lyase-like PEP mutase family enzyme